MEGDRWIPSEAVGGNRATVARTLLALGLRLEIEASEPRDRDFIPLDSGERLSHFGAGDRLRYRMVTDIGSRLRQGARVRLELEGLSPVPARVRRVEGDRVEIFVDTWLGSPLPEGQLVEDSRWILQSLRWKLLSSLRGRHDELALALLGTGRPRSRTSVALAGDWPELNAEQQAVVRDSFRPGVCLVHGPPGTGKTGTLAAAVSAAAKHGRTVLCVAPSNVATDRLLDEVAQRLEADPRFGDGLLLRLGRVSLKEVEARWGHAVDPWQVAICRLKGFEHPSELRAEVERLVRSCTVLVTTVSRSHLVDLRRRFDVVIIDEAAMTSLPDLYHAATLASREGTVVVAGDPHQLPAVIRSSHPLVRHLVSVDPFRLVGTKGSGGAAPGIRVLRLSMQYRMDAPIMRTANALFYGEEGLQIHPSVVQRDPLKGPAGGASLVLVDSSSMPGHGRKVRRFGNRAHADLIARIVDRISESGGTSSQEIAVLSRYRDQVATIRSKVEQRPGLTVGTVHALQGGEADTVILDLSACPEHEFLGDYLVDTDPDAVGSRLLNVALSRARRRMIVVADLRFLMGSAGIPEGGVARRLLEHFLMHGQCIEPEAFENMGGGHA